MSQPRHHYVPKMLSKRFAGPDGLWFYDGYDTTKRSRGLHRRNPETIFHQRGLNTVILADGTESEFAETIFSQIESGVDPLLQFIVDTVRSGQVPSFRDDAREALGVFTFHLFKRPPEVRRTRLSAASIEAAILASIPAAEQRMGRPATPEEVASLTDPAWLARAVQSTQVAASADVGTRFVPAIMRMGFVYVRTEEGKSFVLGSNPVVRRGGPLERDGELIWPIAPDVAIAFAHPSRNQTLLTIGTRDLRSVNEQVWRQSDALASSSPELIQSLAKKSLRLAARERKAARLRHTSR